MNRLLVLGGTAEALTIARDIAQMRGVEVIYSLAGRTLAPALPDCQNCTVRQGGFGGPSGLTRFIVENDIAALVDSTHPYAAQMAENARGASLTSGIELFKYLRPHWEEPATSPWLHAATPAAAAGIIDGRFSRVFLSSGQGDIAAFSRLSDIWFLVRGIDRPTTPLPLKKHHYITGRGPFDIASETALLREHRIDALVTKNSGGESTVAKLLTADTLGIPIIMIDRPLPPDAAYFEDIASLTDAVQSWLRRQ